MPGIQANNNFSPVFRAQFSWASSFHVDSGLIIPSLPLKLLAFVLIYAGF